MSTAFSEISAGLDEAINHAKGKQTNIIKHTDENLNVKAIRETTGMSQQKFCSTFGISVGILRNWEQGLRTPRGTARVLLQVVQYIQPLLSKQFNVKISRVAAPPRGGEAL